MTLHRMLTVAFLAIPVVAAAQTRRPVTLADHARLVSVGDPQRSPDGNWVAYTVTTTDVDKDRRNTDIWMVKWDGTEQRQLTTSPDNESSPRWSPDGKYLAFVSSRGTEDEKKRGSQVWLLPRDGGEAQRVTDVKGGVSDIQWSPDSTRIAFVIDDEDPDEEPEKKAGWNRKTTPPIVIDRYRFKQDRVGYLKRLYSHIAVVDLATRAVTTLTSGEVDDESPSWSPDGTRIAFISKRDVEDPDRTTNSDVWVIDAAAGATPRQVTKTPFAEVSRPQWSPDGRRIAVLLGDNDTNYAYDMSKLIIVPSDAQSGPATDTPIHMAALDRAISDITWSADGQSIAFLLEDDRTTHVATVEAEDPKAMPVRRTSGRRSIFALSGGKDGNFAVLATSPQEPAEIHALEGGTLRKLTRHNDALISELELATTEDFSSTSRDGTVVNSLIVKPAGYMPGRKYPTLLLIHGGPNGQDEHAFSFDREFFAANGYVVLAVNYRGSSGRGNAWQKAIHADWGNLEVVDLLGAVDEAVRQGIADPDRLGIGGWSYGGISTNYTIATDTRFKAAVSGAGSSMQLSLYGVDQYIVQLDNEVGPPWKNLEPWIKMSYPFLHADRIKTPTLFLSGEKDFNVPIIGGEQMYQALRSQGIDTAFVIYPDQYHGLTIPSYQRDRLRRYLDWFDKYLKPAGGTAPPER